MKHMHELLPPPRFIILTASDSGARGEREDVSGQILVDWIEELQGTLIEKIILPDSRSELSVYLTQKCNEQVCDVIITTGGTGFTARDITPEATMDVAHRVAPGISEALRWEGLKKTPHAMLSRGVSVIREKTLIVNLPGGPKAVKEGTEVLERVIGHIVETLRSESGVNCG